MSGLLGLRLALTLTLLLLRSLLLGSRGGGKRRTADAQFLLKENLGQPETAAGQFTGFIVREQLHPFLTDFSQENIPSLAAQIINRQAGAVLVFTPLLFSLTATLLVLAAQALLLAALLFCLAARLLLLTALLGRQLLSLGIALGALVVPGRTLLLLLLVTGRALAILATGAGSGG
ncbi:MAG: hypothetical protein EOP86_27000, partial [Verrucomicrobiaceae bacterium]